MEQVFTEPVQFSEGVKLKNLLSTAADVHIDATFNNSTTTFIDPVLNLYEDEESKSDSEDVLTGIEDSVKKMTLSSPEYKAFSDLGEMMIDCMSGGDVKLYIIEEGDGPLVPSDAVVTLHYAAYWEGEKIPFDTTLTMNFGAPQRLHLGHGSILPGLEIGLSHVKGPTARFHLLLQPRVTWGERGVLPRIRPEPALFVIVLYNVEDAHAGSRFNDLPSEEQANFDVTMKTVKSIHTKAKELFKKRKYYQAMTNYQQAIHVMRLSRIENESQAAKIDELKIKNYTNLAVCYYKLEKPKYVLNMCECLDNLVDTEKNCKILFYYARAFEMLGKTEDAITYYKKALKLEPKNTEIGAALFALDHRVKKDAAKEKNFWQSAFSTATEEKKSDLYDIDDELKSTVKEMCEELSARSDYVKFDLPNGLLKHELDYIKDMTGKFDKIVILEEGEGHQKRVSIVKKNS